MSQSWASSRFTQWNTFPSSLKRVYFIGNLSVTFQFFILKPFLFLLIPGVDSVSALKPCLLPCQCLLMRQTGLGSSGEPATALRKMPSPAPRTTTRSMHDTGPPHRTGQVTLGAYQVPVYAAEEGMGLDVRKPSLWSAAKPLLGILEVRVQTGESGLPRKPWFILSPRTCPSFSHGSTLSPAVLLCPSGHDLPSVGISSLMGHFPTVLNW